MSQLHDELSSVWTQDETGTERTAYRAVSVKSVLGCILGLCSPLALISPLLWAVPALGAILSAVAMCETTLATTIYTGRKLALFGLSLSLIFGVTAVTRNAIHQWLVRAEAERFAQSWFGFLAQDQPHMAHHLTIAPKDRRPLNTPLWSFYSKNPAARQSLEEFVNEPLTRTLLSLEDRALVRLWKTRGPWRKPASLSSPRTDYIYQIYAVTYNDSGKPTTFFVELQLGRSQKNSSALWQVRGIQGDVSPG